MGIPGRAHHPASIEFQRLLKFVGGDDGLGAAINDLLKVKRMSPELGFSPQIAHIQKFIERKPARLEQISPVRKYRTDAEPLLSDMVRAVLKETGGGTECFRFGA